MSSKRLDPGVACHKGHPRTEENTVHVERCKTCALRYHKKRKAK